MNKFSKLSNLITTHASRFLSAHSAGEILAEIVRVRLMRINPKLTNQFQSFKAVGKSNVGVIFFSQTSAA
jgi:hypothetical protein